MTARSDLQALADASGCELIVRRAAKSYRCVQARMSELLADKYPDCAPDEPPRSNWSTGEGCTGRIERGDLHVECMDDAPAYSSGSRYCAPCASVAFAQVAAAT